MSSHFTIELCDRTFLHTHFNHFAAMHHQIWHNTYAKIKNLPDDFITANPLEYFTTHWQDIINDPKAHILWAHDDENFLGFAVLSSAPYENTEKITMSGLSGPGDLIGSLDHIFILQHEQHSGVGRTLFTHAVKQLHIQGAEQMIIDVYNGNENALGFYHHMGCRMGTCYDDTETREGQNYATPSIMIGIPSLRDFLSTEKAAYILQTQNYRNWHAIAQRSIERNRTIFNRQIQPIQEVQYAL